jgi:lysyl-tRNA synthetase class 1
MLKRIVVMSNNFENVSSWPFVEARRILESINHKTPEKGYVLFETGYGPSGLPHIGTFGEVVRTFYVIKAFRLLAPQIPVRLFCVSDDYDGLRKLPDNIPNKENFKQFIGKSLSHVPDPFGEKSSYAANMNSRLCVFLEQFGFKLVEDSSKNQSNTEFYFCSSYEAYKNGLYNETLKLFAGKMDEISKAISSTLGEERQESYHPFMPVEEDGMVLQNGVLSVDSSNHTITYINSKGVETTQSFLNGGVKLQWKCDFPMRWIAFDVNYEIYGKDVYTNAPVYHKVCEILGKKPPVDMPYELFLDEEGKKISKSKGNGLTIDEWLSYANAESLAYYMFIKPQTAKRLFFDVIPKAVDEYLIYSSKSVNQNEVELCNNPAFFANYKTEFTNSKCDISYSMLLNLAAACNPENKSVLWSFLFKYYNEDDLKSNQNFFQMLDLLVEKAVNYYNNFIKIKKKYITLDENQKNIFSELLSYLEKNINADLSQDEIQSFLYELGKRHNIELKEWFKLLYQSILGLESGPRMGSFIKIYGIENSIELIKN